MDWIPLKEIRTGDPEWLDESSGLVQRRKNLDDIVVELGLTPSQPDQFVIINF